MKQGAIILCGGQSRRMGRPKAWLSFGPEKLLTRIERILSEVVSVRIVVAAAEQSVPPLPSDVILTRDRDPDRGPLEGLRAGLEAAGEQADAFFVSGCDTPLLKPDFVRTLFHLLAPGYDAVVPRDDQHYHPLSAIYHRRVRPHVEQLLSENQLRPRDLFPRIRTREVSLEELQVADPALDSLQNVNHPGEYQTALRRAGYGNPVGPQD